MIVERKRTPMTAASNSNSGMLTYLIGATLTLPTRKQVPTLVAKLGTVFKSATDATATAEALTNIWNSFSLSGQWQLLLRVLFKNNSGEKRYRFNIF